MKEGLKMDQDRDHETFKLNRRRLIGTSAVGVPAMLLHLRNGAPAAAQDATPEGDDGGLVEIATPAGGETGGERSGTIVINVQGNDSQTYQALADGYTALNPNVEVRVEVKPSDGYQEFIRAQFAAGTPEASLVNGNVVADLIQEKKFVDMTAYLDRTSPYTGAPWRDSMDATSIENMRAPSTGEIYTLNLETVQVLWFYNKTAFEKAGILAEAEQLAQTSTNQPTWDQFMGWCDKLTAAGYIPVAIEGDYTSFWELRFGWLARMYLDQFTRDEAELVRAQPGDWNFRQGIDDVWQYDPTDPHNDDTSKVTFNTQRKMIALRDKQQTVNGPVFEALYTNFKQFSDRAAPPGWLGTTDAYPLFLTQEAAIRLDVAALLGNFERDIKSLAEGRYISAGGAAEGAPTPTPLPGRDLETFEIGSFNNPTMEGPEVDAPARTIEVNIGFLSVPKKDQAQNDLEMDFLMYLTSPEGFGIYLENRLDPNNAGSAGVNGPPTVKNVELPADLAEKFAQLKLIGNTEKDLPGTYRARGIADYQPSVREWVDLAQQFFAGDLELTDFLNQYQASVDRLFPEILTHLQLTPADLDDPSKKPASQV
jgi:raffinose/stachyose/melibiose transport system substrate-binding protein